MKLTLIAGARPNFMKIAPIIHAIKKAQSMGKDIHCRLVHTGQHYDAKMSDTFFEELNIPHPDANLECGGGTQAEQTAAIMVAFEKELMANLADLVMVVGDVTSTMACSIVAKKAQHQSGARRSRNTFWGRVNARGNQPHGNRQYHRFFLYHNAMGGGEFAKIRGKA